ncbi:MAG: hypothetical protein MUO19_06910, partial [Dehalococcoidales bacterium]|nr:hypothetical protein [Dehalococcoidales bacterium]
MPEQPSAPLMGSVKYRQRKSFSTIMNDALSVFFKDALRVTLKDPRQAVYFLQTVNNQRKAARKRTRLEKEGTHVP